MKFNVLPFLLVISCALDSPSIGSPADVSSTEHTESTSTQDTTESNQTISTASTLNTTSQNISSTNTSTETSAAATNTTSLPPQNDTTTAPDQNTTTVPHPTPRIDSANSSGYRILVQKLSVVEPSSPYWVWRATIPFVGGFLIFTIGCIFATYPEGPLCGIFK